MHVCSHSYKLPLTILHTTHGVSEACHQGCDTTSGAADEGLGHCSPRTQHQSVVTGTLQGTLLPNRSSKTGPLTSPPPQLGPAPVTAERLDRSRRAPRKKNNSAKIKWNARESSIYTNNFHPLPLTDEETKAQRIKIHADFTFPTVLPRTGRPRLVSRGEPLPDPRACSTHSNYWHRTVSLSSD